MVDHFYREIAGKYSAEVRALISRLLSAISEALGLDSDYLNRIFGRHNQAMVINYYPSCPNPDLTFGLPGHSDPDGITVLMQDEVSGLQVLKNGKWVVVQPLVNGHGATIEYTFRFSLNLLMVLMLSSF